MGTYVDTIRAEKISALLNGEWADVHAIKFLFKPYYDFFTGLHKTQRMLLARAESYWNSRSLPRYVVFVADDFEPDAIVVEWKGDFAWYDCDKIPGKEIGKLKLVADNSRKGFHWEVESYMLELNPT
jgi:hypothetical protein